MTLDELRRKRANDMIAVIDGERALSRHQLARTNVALDDAALRACSARELEWLEPAIALQHKAMVRTVTAPHSKYGVVSPFAPSMLVVIYTARYFLSKVDVYIVYGAVQAVEVPTTRSF